MYKQIKNVLNNVIHDSSGKKKNLKWNWDNSLISLKFRTIFGWVICIKKGILGHAFLKDIFWLEYQPYYVVKAWMHSLMVM